MSEGGFFPGSEPYAASERDLLRAVRDLVAADRLMRRDMSRRMSVGETDLRAIRYVMAAERLGRLATPHDLAEHLGITTAATTTMLDRLGAAGHLERVPHPTDRRSKVLVATDHAYAEARDHLGSMHDRMREIAERVPVEARTAVVEFLREMTELMLEDPDEEESDG